MLNKSFGKLRIGKLIAPEIGNILKIDLHNSVADDFTDKIYDANTHKDDIFMFIDENGRIIGILKGKKWDKKFGDITVFAPMGRKNWNNFSEHSTRILRVPFEELKYRPRYNKKYLASPVLSDKDLRKKLEARLSEYKVKKYEKLSISDLESKLKMICNTCIELAFSNNTDEKDISTRVSKISGPSFSYNIATIMEKTSRYMSDMCVHKNRLLSYKKAFKSEDAINKEELHTFIRYSEREFNEYLSSIKPEIVAFEQLCTKLQKIYL